MALYKLATQVTLGKTDTIVIAIIAVIMVLAIKAVIGFFKN